MMPYRLHNNLLVLSSFLLLTVGLSSPVKAEAATSVLTPSSSSSSNNKYKLDRDTATDCSERVNACLSSNNDDNNANVTTFLECPVTCSKSLEPPYPMVQGRSYTPEVFYGIKARSYNDDSDTKSIDFEQFDGLITVVTAVPLKHVGMTKYYIEMTEQLVRDDPYRTACVILPFVEEQQQDGENSVDTDDHTTDKIIGLHDEDNYNKQQRRKRKCIILEAYKSAEMGTHPLIQYLDSVKRSQAKHQIFIDNNQTYMFMVNHDALLVERRVTPTYEKMKKVVKHYYDIMDREL